VIYPLVEKGYKVIGHDKWHIVVCNPDFTNRSTIPTQKDLDDRLVRRVYADLGLLNQSDSLSSKQKL